MRISVVTAVWNGAATIEDCLRSVASQTHPDVEHVIVDGASKDGTPDLVRAFPGRKGPFVSEPDKGLYDALNKGFRMATGEAIGVGADDAYEKPDALAAVAETLQRTGADSCYGDLLYVRRDDPSRVVRTWRSGEYRPGAFRRGWMPPHPTFFARRGVYEKHGTFDTAFRIAADYELMLRLFERHHISTAYLPKVLVRMRLGGMSNAGVRQLIRKSSEDRRAWAKNGLPGGWGTILLKNVSKLPQFLGRSPAGPGNGEKG